MIDIGREWKLGFGDDTHATTRIGKLEESIGVLSDRIISLIVKGKGYHTFVRPVMLYGAETLGVKKVHMKKSWQIILIWMRGVTKQDRKMNEIIKGAPKVRVMSMQVEEHMLKWYGHEKRIIISRQESDHGEGAGVKNERKTKSEVVG